jgi:hypothetical protein
MGSPLSLPRFAGLYHKYRINTTSPHGFPFLSGRSLRFATEPAILHQMEFLLKNNVKAGGYFSALQTETIVNAAI